MAALSYMQRRASGVYEFRKRVVAELAGRPAPAFMRSAFPALVNAETGRFKREVVLSLGTKDPKLAKKADLRKASEFFRMMEEALALYRAGPPTEPLKPLPTLADFEAEAYRSELAADEEHRTAGDAKRHLQTEAERQAIRLDHPPSGLGAEHPDAGLTGFGLPRGMSAAHHLAYGGPSIDALTGRPEGLEVELAELREAFARRDPSIVANEARAAFARLGEVYRPDLEPHFEAALAILRGALRAAEQKVERQRGAIIPTPSAPVSDKGPKLSEAYSAWKGGSSAKGGKKPAARTLQEAGAAVRRFEEWHGDKRLGDITAADVRSFRNALERTPVGLTAKERKLSFRKLLEADHTGREYASATTVNKHLTILKAVVSHAIREGAADAMKGYANPFTGVRTEVDERGAVKREPLNGSDLKAIFSGPVHVSGERPKGGCGEAAYWLPVLLLLTGARLNELVQLRASDVRRDPDSEVWFFDIGTSGGRTVKTASSRRQVPLHPELGRMGFLKFLEARQKAGGAETDLWPEIQSLAPGNRGAGWSKWFNRYMGAQGVTEAGKVLHSFRHTFKRLARDAEVSRELGDALQGHTTPGVGAAYGDGFGLRTLAKAVAKIEAPDAIRSLVWEPRT